MINKIRYALASLKHSYSYINAINDHFLDYYLRHHKIIGWHKGLPVYSAFLTPGLSKPLANTMSRRLMSNLLQKPLPGMINVGVTDICNAKCEHCSFYSAMEIPGEKVLSTQQLKDVLNECQSFGISIINIVGGEPLLRKDLGEVIQSIDKNKSSTCVYTNGWLLEERAQELKDAGVMMVIVSLDSADAKSHDSFRKLPGLYDRAIKGIRKCQKLGMLTAISTTLIQDDLEKGEFEKVVELSKKLKVNELIVFDTMPVGMYAHRKDLEQKKVNHLKLFSLVDKFNKDSSYPGIFCYAHFRNQSTFGCSAGRNYFYLSPYGEMHPCDFTAKPIGNLLETPLPELWDELSSKKQQGYTNSCCSPPKVKKSELFTVLNNK